MPFYNTKINGEWVEIYLYSERGNKKRVVKELKKEFPNIKENEVYLSANAPKDCPSVFFETFFIIE